MINLNKTLNKIPKEFWISYQTSELFYNHIVSIYNSCLLSKVFDTRIKFNNKRQTNDFLKHQNEKLFDWLLKNNFEVEHFLIINKLLLKALIYDFLNFIHESLSSILKRNLIITFTLLRKPFKETLTLIEMIFSDPFLFYSKFLKGNTKEYNPNSLDNNNKKLLIHNVFEKLDIPGFVTPEFLYELRFDRFKLFSYDLFWNKAIHLITNARNIETEKMNLNFLYSDNEDEYNQMKYIFNTLPIILYYSDYLIEDALKLFALSPFEEKFKTRIDYGMILWSLDTHLSNISRKNVLNILNSKKEDINKCPKCHVKIKIDKYFLTNYAFYWIFKCKNCSFEYDFGEGFEIPNNFKYI